jgi:GT2 family glycosyltransferase
MKIAIVTALYYEDRYIPKLFVALERLDYPFADVEVIMIDNKNSAVTREWLKKHVEPKAGKTLPKFHLIHTEVNTGFAGGNNACMRLALEHGCEAIYLLNEDAHGDPGFLKAAVDCLAAHPEVGAVQSFIVLDPPEQEMNSIGNAVQFLGFGYSNGYRMKRVDAEGLLRVRSLTNPILPIGYASGAAVLYRTEALKKVGLLDEHYFLYHEDIDLSWRIREAGYEVVIEPRSVVYHAYEFKKSISKFYWMERNRMLFLLEHYKIGTLLLVAPMLAVMELGLLGYSVKNGMFKERMRVYGYFLNPAHWSRIARKRRELQRARVIGDRVLLRPVVGDILFQDIQSPIMRVVNPVMNAYWSVIRCLIVW